MMERFSYVVLGGGMVGGYAVGEMVERGVEPGELCVISDDDALPYKRPPLSKEFLKGEAEEAEVLINDADLYADHGIEVRLNAHADAVDFEARQIAGDGLSVGFEKLLIATGAWPRPLPVPGADLDGVHLLRTLAHSKAIKAEATAADRAVVIGGGFIGMELAAGLTVLGVETALVYREPRVMVGRFPEPIADYFEDYYRDQGVELIAGADIAGIEGDGRVSGVTLADGRTLPADMVVAGIGVTPRLELFEGGPLTLDDGIVVNECLEARVDGVYVAGDSARYHDVLFDRMRRFEHADNAQAQGKHVAGVMLGEREPFRHVPNFYSDMFDLSWNYYGDRSLGERVVYRGEVDSGKFVAWWLADDGRPVGSFVLGIPWQEAEVTAQIIEQGKPIPEDVLADGSRELEELVEGG